MPRLRQLLFVTAWLALCWLAMQAIHELGHILGAWLTGGTVQAVVLHPLAVSRTDVSPNPHPGLVVWLGPLLGCLLPLLLVAVVPRRWTTQRLLAQFFAGFCLIANGAYISIGSFDRVGDCGEMLRTGSPRWMLVAFGLITMPLGLLLWHRLGSPRELFRRPELLNEYLVYGVLVVLLFALTVEVLLSFR